MNTLNDIVSIVRLAKQENTTNPDAYDASRRIAFNKIAKVLETAGLIKAKAKIICEHDLLPPLCNKMPCKKHADMGFDHDWHLSMCKRCWMFFDAQGNEIDEEE
jgi:hypothetical protein